jgi:hypothetical protein
MEEQEINHINIIPQRHNKITVKASEIIKNVEASETERHSAKKTVNYFY